MGTKKKSPPCYVQLMNTPSVTLGGKQIVFPYRKVEGFFYYLCVEKRILRSAAISVFWADCSDASARKNLRDVLYHIKQILGEDMILAEGYSVLSLNPAREVKIDLDLLQNNILDNYTGLFLRFFYIKNCLEFEDWMSSIRSSLQKRYITAAEEAANRALQKEDTHDVIRYCDRLLQAPYLNESFYRKAIRYLTEKGDYTAALSLYHKLSETLRQELDEMPETKTVSLFEHVMSLRRELSLNSTRSQDFFLGREEELRRVLQLFREHDPKANPDSPNFVLISGEAGVGKTALLERIRQTVPSSEDCVFFYDCIQSESKLYLKPWNDLVRKMQNVLQMDKDSVFSLLGKPLREERNDLQLLTTQFGIWVEDYLRTFIRQNTNGVLLLFLDDLQWMDASSVLILQNILEHLKKDPLFIVGATRLNPSRELEELITSLLRTDAVRLIDLHSFTEEETKKYIRTAFPKLKMTEKQLADAFSYTQGNALFLNELLRSLEENGAEAMQKRPMTSRIVGIIQGRLSKFSEEELRLLEMISVFHRKVTANEINLLFQHTDVSLYILLERLLSHRIIEEEFRDREIVYFISHVLIRNYVRELISEGRKRAYARTIAEHFEALYEKTGDINYLSDCIYYFGQAQDTVKHYTYLIEYYKIFFSGGQEIYPTISVGMTELLLVPDHKPNVSALISLAEEIRALPQHERAYQELRMKMEYLIGRFDLSCGDYNKGLRNINACINAASELKNHAYLIDSYRQMIYYAIQVYDLPMMRQYINLCKTLLKKHRMSDRDRYFVQRIQALYNIKTGKLLEAEKLLKPLVKKLESLKDTDASYLTSMIACYNYLCEIEMEQHHWEAALQYAEYAVDCSGQTVETAGGAVAHTNMGIILYQMKLYKKSKSCFHMARNIFTHISMAWGKAKEETYSAFLELQLNNPNSAVFHYRLACKYVIKDYSPSTVSLLNELYTQLKAEKGLEIDAPPSLPVRKKKTAQANA